MFQNSVNRILSFLFMPFFLFFGMSSPILAGFYIALLALVSGVNTLRLPYRFIFVVVIAASMEMIYRYRANGDGVLELVATMAGFVAIFLASLLSDFNGRHRLWFLLGSVFVVSLIMAERVYGFSYFLDNYELSSGRSVGKGISDPNAFALIHIAMLFPILASEKLSRLEKILVVLSAVSIPLYSLSRTSVLLIACLFLLGFPKFITQKLWVKLIGLLMLICGLYYAIFVIGEISGRLTFADSIYSRTLYVRLGIETLAHEFTLLGVENSSSLKVRAFNFAVDPSFHNTFVSLIAACGVYGIWGLFLVYRSVYKIYSRQELFAALAILASIHLTTGYLVSLAFPILLGAQIGRRNKTR